MNIISKCVILLSASILLNMPINGEVVLWKFKTNGIIYSTPLIINDRVYIGSADSFFYALNLNDGTQIWKYKSADQIFSTAAYSDSIICFESGNVLYGLNYNGSEKWKVTITSGPVTNHYDDWDYFHSSPLIVDSIAYCGSQKGQLIGVNIYTGDEVFRINTGDTGIGIRVRPAVFDNKIYFGECGGNFYCYDLTTGEQVWKYDTNPEKLWQDPAILTNPVIKDSIVYFAGRHCHLYGLNVLTGKKVWWYSDPNNMWILGGPTISDTLIYVGSSNQKMLHLLNIRTHKLLWRKIFDARIFGTPLVDSDYVFFGTGMEINDKIGSLWAVNKLTGEIVNRFFVNSQVHSSPVIAGNKIIFGCKEGYVFALDKEGMLNCEHPQTRFSETGELLLGEINGDSTISVGINNSCNTSDSVSFSISAPSLLYRNLILSPKDLHIDPQSHDSLQITINASNLSPKDYTFGLIMDRHFFMDPAAAKVTKNIKFKVPEITSVSKREAPLSFSLSQNYPNPFNPATKIKYSIADAGFVELKVFNSIGEEVAQLVKEYKNAGNYEVQFDAGELNSGVYFYRLVSGNFSSIKKFTILK
ncbi:MAG TPA: PQQ-binding-like beta-propeller repeat protein [Ignavibacteriaceae bacterium]|nr:PQQ-binding-like beta-propeller repeat protein [Ignavibacteriaceae bacterium]